MDTVKTLAEAVNEFHKPQGSTKKADVMIYRRNSRK